MPIPHDVLSLMPRVRHVLLALLMAALAGPALAAAPPHIIVILVDDMGYGDLRSYNPHSKISTPHIDRLAAEGMRFTDAHAAGPLCHPSRYGLMTGRYPFRTDISRWPTRPLIDDGQITLRPRRRPSRDDESVCRGTRTRRAAARRDAQNRR